MSAATIQSFLMLGQSNMAGRGDLGAVPDIVHPDILMLREQGWVPMQEPINPDRPFAGVGLAASFA
ncbi:MAG: sialate O-acetylesterase [Lentisphaerae bacterium]|nr:sialate O-acetylesterase [Lentisphaerota bacterium]